jgi:hypothetical protein
LNWIRDLWDGGTTPAQMLVFVLLMVVIGFFAAVGSDHSKPAAIAKTERAFAQRAPAAPTTIRAVETPAPTATPLPALGPVASVPGAILTVNSMTRKQAIQAELPADADHEYVSVEITLRHPGTGDWHYNAWDFMLKDATGVEAAPETFAEPGALEYGDLAPDDLVRGTLYFLVNRGASGLVLTYRPGGKGQGFDIPRMRVRVD